MKREIPVPVVIAGIVLVLALAGFAMLKVMSGPPEFAPPKTSKTIPKYIWDGMNPQMQSKMKQDGYEPGDVQPSGQPQRSAVNR
jgi:hypothetical protein